MTDTDSLINDLQDYLQDKQPPYLRKLERLHPDNLIYRMLLKLEDMELEIKELQVANEDLESEIKDLEYVIAGLENEAGR
jgi:transcriptional regulator of aromatic amino acid metabolism